jgi:Leucine-rich repeat (LRR) protein
MNGQPIIPQGNLVVHVRSVFTEKLDLSGLNLKKLSSTIGAFQMLQRLNLSKNKLKNLPTDIVHLSNLQSLNLNDNRLISLPSELGELPKLEYLTFANNPVELVFKGIGEYDIDTFKMYMRCNPGNMLEWTIMDVRNMLNIHRLTL